MFKPKLKNYQFFGEKKLHLPQKHSQYCQILPKKKRKRLIWYVALGWHFNV